MGKENARGEAMDPQTEFRAALGRCDYAAAKAAVGRGADIRAVGADGLDALARAAAAGADQAIWQLIKMGADPDGPAGGLRPGQRMLTPLMLAVEASGGEKAMSVLIMAGADVDAFDPDGRSALMRAVGNGSSPRTAILLEAGASCEAPVDGKWPDPLVTAVMMDHPQCLALLIGWDAPLVRAESQSSLACLAARKRGGECMGVLIRGGADIDSPDKSGKTPAILAAKMGYVKCLSALMEAGADPSVKDPQGLDAFDWAVQSGDADCVELLRPIMAAKQREELARATPGGAGSTKKIRV